MLSDWRYRLRALFRRSTVEVELDQELRFHFEQQVEKLIRAGLPRAEAMRRGRLAFGGIEQVKEECRDSRGLAALEALFEDTRHALRLWRRNPGFALAAIAAIGLGLGANAAVFTLANAVLFKTLAYEGNGHLVYVMGVRPGCQFPCDLGRSYPDFLEFRSQARSLDALVAYSMESANLSDAHALPERYMAMQISANGFPVFGVKPVAGRDFVPADERPGAVPVAILTYTLWASRYGKDPSIVGRTIRVNQVPTVVVGVMPAKMQFRASADLWVPLAPSGREGRDVMILGRLAKGAVLAAARSELDTISRRLASQYPATDKDLGIRVLEGKDYFYPRVRLLFAGLWIVVGLVLLVACANVANLLLGRAVARSREISIRVALGAGRWRVIRQLLTESVTLSVAGGMLGWLLAVWGVRAFDGAIAGTGKPPWLDFSMDYTVFAYLCAITAGAGILFGLAPALRLSRVDVHTTLKNGGQGASGGTRGRSLSGLLVAGEMAAAVVLLVGTVVVVRTLLSLYNRQVGVNTANMLTMSIDLPEKKYPRPDDWISFYRQLQARLEALPGVVAACVTQGLPGHGGMSFTYELEGAAPVDAAQRPKIRGLVVGPGYFRTMDARPLAGREFAAAGGATGLPTVMVNHSFAAAYWRAGNPIGRRLRLFRGGAPQPWLTVIGVAPDIWQNDMTRREFQPLIYLPLREMPLAELSVSRTRVPAATLGPAFRRAVQAMDEDLPVYGLRTLDEDLALHDWGVRVFGSMFTIFSAIAMVLASVGLYAVIAHSVNRRTQEIGVRMAMGATAANIVASVFAQGMRQVALGLAVGLAAAFGLMRLLRAILAGGLEPDAGTFAIVTLVLVAAGVAACAIPARRATRVDPAVALRFE